MASVGTSKNGKNPNVELNLVPFIDLMCVCITFLLITAVWTQMSMVKLGTSVLGQEADVAPPVLPPDYVPFRVDIHQDGYALTIGMNVTTVPKIDGKFDEKGFVAALKKIKEANPKKTDAVISIDDSLPYQLLITGMDNLVEFGFKDVGIAVGEVK